MRAFVRGRRFLAGIAAVALAGCAATSTPGASGPATPAPGGTAAAGATVPPANLSIYAAASLKAAMAEATKAYEGAHGGTTLTVSTDSSAALETKIEQGALADVFLSADTTNPAKLVAKGLASGSIVSFAGNSLTVIVPVDNPARIRSPADLARPGIKIIAASEQVPIQRYAVQLVGNLAREPGYPMGFADAYARNIATREDNVAAVVAKVGLGEGDAGIVYVTDATASTTVSAVTVPASANVPATYGGVVVRSSPNQAAAAAFLDWLASPAGHAVLAPFGFEAPSA